LVQRPALTGFALGGGTSLALRFGHRLSLDLDFFTTGEFEPEQLAQQLHLPSATQVNRAPNTLTLDAAGVKLDFLRHAYPLLSAPELLAGIPVLSLPDVVAMKLNAAANRGSKKDFFDLAELQQHLPLGEMLDWFEGKYANADRFTVIRSLSWFDDAESEPDPLSLNGTTWPAAKAAILRSITGLR
jgi:predicted nucleotidyltransferase component of viral defense system